MLWVSMSVAMACILKPVETAQLFNRCESTLKCVGEDIGRKIVPCDALEVSLKVLGLIVAVSVTAVDGALFTLVDDSLPVSLYPTARHLGILVGYGDAVVAAIWKVLFIPFEFASFGLPALSAAFAGQVLVMTIGTFNACINELRYD